ncbi:MAG TPA: PHB depolymerase family esterase [Acidimicrobiales bacterium]|jgi:polyhydroxybutyrate depolymerase|nr:PHB depolymerase family esterase [Acidimicrobiales bacterium]
MNLRRGCAVLVICLLTAAACSSDSKPSVAPSSSGPDHSGASGDASASSAAIACTRPHAPGQTDATFDFQGVPRTYQLYVPAAYDGTSPVPVVFEFHGYGSTAKQQVAYGDFRALADRDDFLIVAPDGQDRGGRHFNLGTEPGLQNDIQMVGALLDVIETQFCVDTRRVYSTGMSDGGAMTSVLACLSADRFAAFAPVAVVLYPMVCANTRQLAFEGFSGTADPIIPFEGGAVRCCGMPVLPAPSVAMSNWAAHNGCDPNYTEDRLGTEVRRQTWNNCQGGSSAVFYVIDGGGHTWPGSASASGRLGLTTTQIDASETIWDFFKQHPLPSPPR